MTTLDPAGRNLLFNDARTHNGWTAQPVSDDTLREMFDLLKMAPTSANCSPARFLFLRSPQARQRLGAALLPGNLEKTLAAPVTAIIAYDLAFHEQLPRLFPHADARSWFAGNEELIRDTAFRNGTLQGAYMMLAARAVGLDCGPMSGFDNAKVDEAFFAGTPWRSNFLCNLGHGDPSKLFPRSPRFQFEDACRIL
ncbi:MAG: malonic semialdehyde reductase [Burkholderiales bacterium]|nr:malonic semialdehyde reductase [Burkholderiales bacterium]